MGTRIAARHVLRWAVRNAFLQSGRCHRLQSLGTVCRCFCSSTSQIPPQHNHDLRHVPKQPVTELSLSSLLDVGFTDSQAEQINDVLSTLKGGRASKHALTTITLLLVLGLNPSSVLKLLEKCPELCTMEESHLQQRISNMRKMGLVEGSLQRVVCHWPQILTVPVKTVKHVVVFLREKCLFTGQQVTEILRDSPAVVLEDLDQLEYKFQYVYFRMGVKQAEMVKSKLFRFTLDDVRCRHCFLERRGMYQTPDKKGQTSIVNPKLNAVLRVDEETFLTDVAAASAEEYDVFRRLIAREWHEDEWQQGKVEADAEDEGEEDDDEEEDEEESRGKSGYTKRRRK